MTPFVTGVLGCTCPRCIAFATPAAPHEFWDRATPPPIEGFIEGQIATTPQTVVPTPTVTFPIVPQPQVQIVPVGTPLAEVIGFPGNPFLD